MTSHIMFDSSYVSDTWDWFESTLIVTDRELWYDLTLGHSHLRESFSGWPLCRGILFSVDDGFLSHVRSSKDIRCLFSTLEHETWLAHFIWSTLHRGIPFSVDDGFFRHSCPLEAIRFISHWSMRYDWVISLMWSREHSLLIIVDIFLNDWIRTRALMRACSRV